jgi:hypothetical protein
VVDEVGWEEVGMGRVGSGVVLDGIGSVGASAEEDKGELAEPVVLVADDGW